MLALGDEDTPIAAQEYPVCEMAKEKGPKKTRNLCIAATSRVCESVYAFTDVIDCLMCASRAPFVRTPPSPQSFRMGKFGIVRPQNRHEGKERRPHDAFVVIHDDAILSVNKTSGKLMERLYGNKGVILTVGDGDFSFSRALASELDLPRPPSEPRLVATSYDSLREVCSKYAGAQSCIATLGRQNSCVLHGVDATSLTTSLLEAAQKASARTSTVGGPKPPSRLLGAVSRAIFNFPHVGGATKEDVDANQTVIRCFLASVRPLLVPPLPVSSSRAAATTSAAASAVGRGVGGVERKTPQGEDADDVAKGGQVHVALRSSSFYQSWDVEGLARSAGYVLLRKEPFRASAYPGYQEQRTNPAVMRALPPAAQGADILVFVVDPAQPALSAEEYAESTYLGTAGAGAFAGYDSAGHGAALAAATAAVAAAAAAAPAKARPSTAAGVGGGLGAGTRPAGAPVLGEKRKAPEGGALVAAASARPAPAGSPSAPSLPSPSPKPSDAVGGMAGPAAEAGLGAGVAAPGPKAPPLPVRAVRGSKRYALPTTKIVMKLAKGSTSSGATSSGVMSSGVMSSGSASGEPRPTAAASSAAALGAGSGGAVGARVAGGKAGVGKVVAKGSDEVGEGEGAGAASDYDGDFEHPAKRQKPGRSASIGETGKEGKESKDGGNSRDCKSGKEGATVKGDRMRAAEAYSFVNMGTGLGTCMLPFGNLPQQFGDDDDDDVDGGRRRRMKGGYGKQGKAGARGAKAAAGGGAGSAEGRFVKVAGGRNAVIDVFSGLD